MSEETQEAQETRTFVDRKWQKVQAPPSWAGNQYQARGLTHQVQFDDNAVGLILVEEAGEKIGATQFVPQADGSVEEQFITPADIVDRVEDFVLLDEFVVEGDEPDGDEADGDAGDDGEEE